MELVSVWTTTAERARCRQFLNPTESAAEFRPAGSISGMKRRKIIFLPLKIQSIFFQFAILFLASIISQ